MAGKGKKSKHPSDSEIQKEAESEILVQISKDIGCKLRSKKIGVTDGVELEIDGYSENPPVLCEVYSHIGKLKRAQYQKVLTDALKIIYVEKKLSKNFNKILAFVDGDAARCFETGTWYAECIKEFNIVVKTVSINDSLRRKIIEAQKRQAEGQSHSSKHNSLR